MLTALGPWRLRSSGAHCDPKLVKRIGEKLGEEDWRGGEEGEGEGVLIKSSNPHLAGGETHGKTDYNKLPGACSS